jgi:hypothetical protein
MSVNAAGLIVGEVIEIKYRVAQHPADSGSAAELTDRWITAEIVHQEFDAPPMARLADGQITDIRPYMVWRRIPGMGAASVTRSDR